MHKRPINLYINFMGLLFLAVGLFLSPAMVGAASLEDEVAQKNKEMAARKKEIQGLTDQERKLNKDLAKLEKAMQSSAAQLQDLEKKLAELHSQQQDNAQQLETLLAEREQTNARLKELLHTLWFVYITGQEKEHHGADQWAEANRHQEWLKAMYHEAQSLHEQIEAQSRVVNEQQKLIAQNAEEVASQKKKILSSQAQLDKNKADFQRQVQQVRTKKAQGEKELQNLTAAIAALRHKISLQPTKQITKNQGKLSWPAQGKTVVSFAPNKKPASNGIGLALASGTPIRSMSWGKVVHNDQLRGFGQVVVIFHGDDHYSLYSFLSQTNVRVGQEVERGQQIGICGFYPAAQGDGLYFELRFRQKAINPLKWLQPG